ncbi:MAG: recombination regulator RecX [Nocardioidaceae bacterium]|nr:recombination regulator RecX [Nocardioidaceae bacterium]
MPSNRRRTSEPPEHAPGEEADPESVARKILLDQLSMRARSRGELEERLTRRDVPEDVAGALLDRFEEVGLVDDEAFARAWVEARQRTRGLARPARPIELQRKHNHPETIRTVLGEVDVEDEEETARRLVRKKLRSMSNLADAVATRRLVGMLARKGYAPGLAYTVVRQELAGAE